MRCLDCGMPVLASQRSMATPSQMGQIQTLPICAILRRHKPHRSRAPAVVGSRRGARGDSCHAAKTAAITVPAVRGIMKRARTKNPALRSSPPARLRPNAANTTAPPATPSSSGRRSRRPRPVIGTGAGYPLLVTRFLIVIPPRRGVGNLHDMGARWPPCLPPLIGSQPGDVDKSRSSCADTASTEAGAGGADSVAGG